LTTIRLEVSLGLQGLVLDGLDDLVDFLQLLSLRLDAALIGLISLIGLIGVVGRGGVFHYVPAVFMRWLIVIEGLIDALSE